MADEKEKPQVTEILLQEEKAMIKTHGKFLIPIGWILIALSVLVTIGMVQGSHQRDPSIEAFLNHPDSPSLGGTIGVIIGTNLLTLPAMLFGIYAMLRKNAKGKPLAITSIILFFIIAGVQFLPSHSSDTQSYSRNDSYISNKEIDSSQLASEIAKELKGISKGDIIKEFIEKIDNTSLKYTSNQDGFFVIYPSKPTLTEVTGDIQTTRNYQAYSDSGPVSYNVFFNIFKKKILSSSAIDAYLKAALTGRLVAANQSRIIKEELIIYKGFKAHHFVYLEAELNPPILHEGLIFLLDGDSVSLTMLHPNSVVPDYSFDKFVASFNLIPLAPQLKEESWKDKVSGLRIRPPIDMDVYKTNNPKTGLIVMFSNKAGHSLGIFDISVLYPNMTNSDIERELSSQEKDLDNWYRVQLSNSSTTTKMVQLTKILEHGSKIYMVQGYGPAKTLFRSELKLKKAAESLTFIEDKGN